MGCPFLIHSGGGIMAKEVAVRAVKTFWQAAIAYLVATLGAGVDLFEREVIGGILVGALAAGLSASWNGVVQPILDKSKGGM